MSLKLLSIARLTFKAALSEKLLQLAAFFAVAMMLLSIALGALAPGADAKIMADFGLGSIQAAAVFIAIALASADMPREMERRTLYVVLSKPIGRSTLISGKYLGFMGALAAMSVVMGAVFLGILALFHLPVLPQLVVAIGFGLLETFVLLGMAILFSLLTSPTLSALYTLVFFVLGHQTGIIRAFGRQMGGATQLLTELMYRLVPNLEVLNLKNDVIYGNLPSGLQLAASAAYAVCLIVGLGGISVLVLRRKEF